MPWTSVCLKDEDICCFEESGHRCLTYVEALLEAHRMILENDPESFVIGEGVDDAGGVFGSTLGLVETFGERVMDMPVAENGMTGVCLGAAAAGMKPILVHMRADFLAMSMDQIVNHAAKWHYMTGGNSSVPLVIRSLIGRGWGSGAQHSQGLHSLFLSVPGLKIAMPATPYDAKGMLIAAYKDPDPVLIFEHRWLYDSKGPVPDDFYSASFGEAVVRKSGKDVTLLAISHTVPQAFEAAELLKDEGIHVELVDPRTIRPLDMKTIRASVEKTGRLVICDVAHRTAGYGAEVVCRLAEQAPGCLKAPVQRVSFPDLPTPASSELEAAYYPGVEDIVEAVRAVTVA